MSFRTKKSLDMYCKSSYILLVVAACAIATGGEKSSATVGKTKVVSTTGLGTTGSLQRTGSGGLGTSSQLQRTSSLRSGSLSSGGSGNATLGSTARLSISSVGSGVSQQSGLVGIDPSSGLPTGKVQHKYGVSASDFNVLEVPGGINPGERYVQFTNTKGKLVTYKEGLSTKLKLLWKESEIGKDHYVGSDGRVHTYIYRSSPNWVSGADIINAQGGDGGSSSLPQQQGNISSSVTGLGNKSVGTQTETGNLGGLGTPRKDTGTLTGQKYTSQLNLAVGKDGSITQQNKGTNTGDGAGLGTSAGISKTQLNVNGDGKVTSRSIGTNTGTPSGVSETELNIDGRGKVTTRSVGTNTEGVGETTSVVTPLGGDKEFSDSSTQTLISGSGVQPKKRTNKGVATQTDPSITGDGLTSLVAKSDESQTSSGDGGSIPVNSVVYNFGNMPRFVYKGSEGDAVKPSTGTQTSSQGDGVSSPVKSVVHNFDKMPKFIVKGSEGDTVKSPTRTQTSSQGDGDGGSGSVKSIVYNFDKMPKFTAKGSEGDTGKTSTSVGTDVASGGEKTTKPLTDTGSGGSEKTYTSTLKINLGGKGQQSTGGDDKKPQNQYLADMAERLGSLFLRKDVDKNGNIVTTDYTKSILGTGQPEVVSVKPAAGNKGASGSGASSSLGQQSSSTQTGGGAGAQGGSGDGSGGKKTPSSPVSGQTTSSSAQIEVKDEEGKIHQAVLVNTKGTSGGGAQGGSGSSPSGNKGASSSGQQGQGSSSQQSASGSGAQGGSGDGSGGKRTSSSPVSGQTTSASSQIEVKDEEGKTHQAVLVNTKGTSGGGASKKPGLSTIVEEGESSQLMGEQDKKSISTQTKDGRYQAILVEVDEEGKISQVIGQQGKGSLVQTQTGDEKKHSSIFVTLDKNGNIVQTSGQQGEKSSSIQTGGAGAQKGSGVSTSGSKGTLSSGQQDQDSLGASGGGVGEQGEGGKGSKPLTGAIKGTVVTSSEGKEQVLMYTSTVKKQTAQVVTSGGEGAEGTSGASPSGSRGASLGQQSSSSQTGSGAGAQGGSGSSTSGKGTSSSGQQGQGSSSQQSASGSGAQGGSGDGSGGKKTPPSGQQGGEDKGIFVSKKESDKFKPIYVGKSLEELKNMTAEELRNYALNRDYKADFKNIDLSAAKGLNDNELDEFMKTNPVITYELDLNGSTIVEVNNTPYLLGKGYKLTRKTIDKLPSGKYVESVWIDKFAGYDQRIDKSTTSTGAVSQGGNTTGTVPSGQTAQFETSGGAGAQGVSGASTGGSKASSSSSAQKEQGKKGTGDSSSKPIYVGTSLKDLQGLSEEELINHAKNAPVIDWNKIKSALPKASTEEEAKELAKKNPVYTYEVDELGDVVEVNNSRWLYGVGEKTISKVFDSDGKGLDVTSLEIRYRPYSKGQKESGAGSSTGTKPSTSGSGTQGSGGASQKEGSDSSSKTGNQGGSKVGTSVVGETGQTSTSGKAGTQASSEVNKGGSKTSSTSVEQQKQWEGSGKVDFDEVKKSLKPVSGTTTGKETGTSDGIDLNEARKNLRPVSGTTTGKETQGSEGIDLNETRKNLKPVSGTTTEKETGTSGGIDLNEAKKNLRPVSGTGDKKGTEASSGKNFDESKKSSTPVSGGGSGTQGTDGDNTAGKKTKLPLTGNDGQGSDGVKQSSGANQDPEKIRYAYVGYKLADLKNLTQQQLIDRANEINDINVTKIKFNRPSGNTQEEIDDFLANNFIISYNFDEGGNIVRTDWTQKYLNRGPVLTTHKYVREQNGSFKKVKYETEFKPYRSSDTTYTGTGTVPQGETAEFVTSTGKKEQSSSQIVTGGKTPLSPVGGQVELKDDDGNIYQAVLVNVREDEVKVSQKPGLPIIVEEDEGSLKGQQLQGGSGGTDFNQVKSSLKKVTQTTTEEKSSSSSGIDLEQSKLLLKKVSTTEEKTSGGSGGIDFDEAKKNLKPVTQPEKSDEKGSGSITQTDLQLALANLRKTPIGDGMYGNDGNEEINVSDYILTSRSNSASSGGRKQIDFQKNVNTDEKLIDSQGQKGFVGAAAQLFNTIAEEDKKIKVSNQTGSVNVQTDTDENGNIKINTNTTSQILEDVRPLVLNPEFAKTLARNIKEGYQKKLEEMESKGLSQ